MTSDKISRGNPRPQRGEGAVSLPGPTHHSASGSTTAAITTVRPNQPEAQARSGDMVNARGRIRCIFNEGSGGIRLSNLGIGRPVNRRNKFTHFTRCFSGQVWGQSYDLANNREYKIFTI